MIFEMPVSLTPDNHTNRQPPGLYRAAMRDGDIYEYEWRINELITTIRLDFITRQITLPDDADPPFVAALNDALAFDDKQVARNTAAQQILDLAQSAVGQDILSLTDGQRWALLAVLMWDRKAIGNDLRVRPLRDWMRRLPDE